jgi:hypothetical protein
MTKANHSTARIDAACISTRARLRRFTPFGLARCTLHSPSPLTTQSTATRSAAGHLSGATASGRDASGSSGSPICRCSGRSNGARSASRRRRRPAPHRRFPNRCSRAGDADGNAINAPLSGHPTATLETKNTGQRLSRLRGRKRHHRPAAGACRPHCGSLSRGSISRFSGPENHASLSGLRGGGRSPVKQVCARQTPC